MIEDNTREFQQDKTDYKTVLELAQSQAERETLSKIKEDLDLRDFDSLWSIVGVLQMYLRTVSDFHTSTKDSIYDAVKAFGENGGIIRTTDGVSQDSSSVNYFFLAAAMLLFGSVTFAAGALLSGASPAWLIGTPSGNSGPEQIVHLVLKAPAGWILCLMLSVPAFFYIKTYYLLFKLARKKGERALHLSILLVLLCLVCIAVIILIKIMSH